MLTEISRIAVGERRREDYGDIEGLAASIERYGLIHPVVIDDAGNLVAGERRLKAVQLLAWTDVPTRSLGDLSETERREIELEENRRRKDLEPYELSKRYVDQAPKVAADLRKQVSGAVPETPDRGGRPATQYGVARTDIAQALGISERTLMRAEQHVESVDRYPELRALNGSAEKTVKIAAALDAMPEDEREAAREKIRKVDSDTLNDLLGQPRADHEATRRYRQYLTGQSTWASVLTRLTTAVTEIDRGGGVEALMADWPVDARRAYAADLTGVATALTRWASVLTSEEE